MDRMERCETCRFFWGLGEKSTVNRDEEMGVCRRHPPSLLLHGLEMLRQGRAGECVGGQYEQPIVTESDWCGEWRGEEVAAVTAGHREAEARGKSPQLSDVPLSHVIVMLSETEKVAGVRSESAQILSGEVGRRLRGEIVVSDHKSSKTVANIPLWRLFMILGDHELRGELLTVSARKVAMEIVSRLGVASHIL